MLFMLGSIYDHHWQICVWESCWLGQALCTTSTDRFVCENHVDWVGLYIRPPLRTYLCVRIMLFESGSIYDHHWQICVWESCCLCQALCTTSTDRFVCENHVDWVRLYIRPPLRTDLCVRIMLFESGSIYDHHWQICVWESCCLCQALCTTSTDRFVCENHVDLVGLYIRPPLRTDLCVRIMLFESGSIYDQHWQICVWESCWLSRALYTTTTDRFVCENHVVWVRLYLRPALTDLCVRIVLFESGSIYDHHWQICAWESCWLSQALCTTTTDRFVCENHVDWVGLYIQPPLTDLCVRILLIESGSMYDHHWQICVWESCCLSRALCTTTTDRFVCENHVVWVRPYIQPPLTDLCVRILLFESGSIYDHHWPICVWESCCLSRALYTTTTDRFVCENHVFSVGLYVRPPLTDLCVRIMLFESSSIYDQHWQICVWESCCLSRALYTTTTDRFVCENHVVWVGLYIRPPLTDLCVRILLFESGPMYDHHWQICVWESCCLSRALYTTTTDRFVCENHVVWVGLYIRPPLTDLCVRIMLFESGPMYDHHWQICVWESCCVCQALCTTSTDRFVCENHVVWVGPYIRPPLKDLCVRIMLFMSGSMYDQHWQICVWESCWLSRALYTTTTTDRFVCENHVVWVELYIRPPLTDLCVRILLFESGSIYDHHWQICVWESCCLSQALYTTTTDRFVCENLVVWVGLYIRPPLTDLCVRIMLFESGSIYNHYRQICVWESCFFSRALYTTTTDRFVCENHVVWVGLYIRPPLTDLCVRIMLFESGPMYDHHWQICVWESCCVCQALCTTSTDRFVCENHVVWVRPYIRPPLKDLCVRIMLCMSGSMYDQHWQICVWESCWLSRALYTTTTTDRFVCENHVVWVGLYIRPPLTDLCVRIMLFESGPIYDHHWQICVWESCCLSQALYTTTTDRFVCENLVVWVGLYIRPPLTDLCVRIMLIESGSIYNHHWPICVWESCCLSRALYTTTTDRFVCENHVVWVELYILPPLTDLCVRIMLFESGSIYDHHWQICVWESCCLSRALYTTTTDIFVCENHVVYVRLYVRPPLTDLCVRIMLIESDSIYDHHWQICVWESCCLSRALYTTSTDRFVCENHVDWVGPYIRPPLTDLCVRIMLF